MSKVTSNAKSLEGKFLKSSWKNLSYILKVCRGGVFGWGKEDRRLSSSIPGEGRQEALIFNTLPVVSSSRAMGLCVEGSGFIRKHVYSS